MDLLIDIALVLAAILAILVVVSLARRAWRLAQRERTRNDRLLDSVYNQHERRRGESDGSRRSHARIVLCRAMRLGRDVSERST